MRLEFGMGQGVQVVEAPDRNVMGVLTANEIARGLTDEAEVERALDNPIGAPRIGAIVRPGEKIAIVTSDVTRPVPSYRILPALLDRLYAAGVRREDVTLVFALGSHRRQTEAEMRRLAGERAYSEIRCVDSDPADCAHLGVTGRGTPVDITRVVARADRRILLGNVEYHYFAGYSGGAKALMPGCSTRDAIRANHSMMVLPEARAGALSDNPLRMDLEEAADISGVDWIVNCVLDEHKHIVRCEAGDVRKAHRALCAYLDKMYRKEIDRRADIVMVSQGGAPKDLNLYQTQKALDNARHAVKRGGVIVLIGSCREGLGEKTFEDWMLHSPSPESMIQRIQRDFQLGGHKAAAIAMTLREAEVDLVSDLEPEFVRQIFLTPRASAQEALDMALRKLGPDATILAMPYGGSTLPHVRGE